MTLFEVMILTLAGPSLALATLDTSVSDFESQLEAAVLGLSFPGFTDVLGGRLLVEEDEVVQRKMRQVLETADLREANGRSETGASTGHLPVPVWNDRLGSTGTGKSLEVLDEERKIGVDFGKREERSAGGGTKTAPSATRRRSLGRRSCPGGAGAYGFNTFNFLTFALQVFNGVVNAVNHINNNNNNNNDNSQNSVNVNTDQVSSNSNSANAILVIIPPNPGRRKRHLTSCSTNEATALHAASAVASLLQQYVDTHSTVPEACQELHVCRIVRQVASSVGFEAVYWKFPFGHLSMNSAPCELLFHDCRHISGKLNLS